MTRLFLALLLTAGAFLPVPALAQDQADDPTVIVAEDDPEMTEAIAVARSHLDLFLGRTTDAEGHSDPAAFVKVAVPTPGAPVTAEHVWVAPFHRDGDLFTGVLSSAPVHFDHTAEGQILAFSRAQISDWGYAGADGLLYGFYTSRVGIARLPAADAAEAMTLFSADPMPGEW